MTTQAIAKHCPPTSNFGMNNNLSCQAQLEWTIQGDHVNTILANQSRGEWLTCDVALLWSSLVKQEKLVTGMEGADLAQVKQLVLAGLPTTSTWKSIT